MRGSMNEARVQTVPMAQLLLSRNAHFGEHRLCEIGHVSSSNRYSERLPPLPRAMKQAPAPTFIHGAGTRRSPVTSAEMMPWFLKLFGPADVSSYPTYPPLLGSELFDTDSESNTAQN
jgi:hypothetical protein